MYKNKKIIAIITARSGSKRFKDKNIAEFNGIPMILHSIFHAKKSKYIDEIFISTDSKKYLDLCGKVIGTSKMELRPKRLAKDRTSHNELLLYYAKKWEDKYDYLVLLQPTTPFRKEGLIDKCIESAMDHANEKDDYMYQGCLICDYDGNPTGSVYVYPIKNIVKNGRFLGGPILLFENIELDTIDINTKEDLILGEQLVKSHNLCSKQPVKIGEFVINNDSPCFVIAEIGVNHNGSVELAKEMVREAQKCGADAVKFQCFRANAMKDKGLKRAKYQGKGTQYEMLGKLELSFNEFRELKRDCDKRKIMFLSSAFDKKCVDFLDKLGVPAFKVGSGEITNLSLLEHIAKKGKPIILSTGMADMVEVANAVNTIEQHNKQIILLHCTSNYPTLLKDVNLKAITTLQEVFPYYVGYSDHTLQTEVACGSVYLGAKILEKHFTLDDLDEGPDHESSFEPPEFKELVYDIKITEGILGNGVKKPCKEEISMKKLVRGRFE